MIEKLKTIPAKLIAAGVLAPATIVRVVDSYDELTDQTTSTETVVPCHAGLTPLRYSVRNGLIDTQHSRQSEVTQATITIAVVDGDRLRFGSREYVIGDVTEIAPFGDPYLWKAIVS